MGMSGLAMNSSAFVELQKTFLIWNVELKFKSRLCNMRHWR